MATAYTKSDALCLYLTAPAGNTNAGTVDGCLGGYLVPVEVPQLSTIVAGQIPPVIIQQVNGTQGEGSAQIRTTEDGLLAYTAPGGTEGTPVAVVDGASVLLEGAGTNESCRVMRDGSAALEGGGFDLELFAPYNGAIGGADVDGTSATDTYTALMIHNPGEVPVFCFAAFQPLSTAERVSDGAQLGATGSGTITTSTTDGFADYPASGWASIRKADLTAREVVYYTSRNATSLFVTDAAHRALLGSTASAGAADDKILPCSGVQIGTEAPDAEGMIQTIANNTTAPTGVTWYSPTAIGTDIPIGTLAPLGNYGLWIRRSTPAGMTVNLAQETSIGLVVDNTYSQVYHGKYRVTGASSFAWYVGEDAMPDFTAAPFAENVSSIALTPPISGLKTFYVVLRLTDTYGLTTYNTFPHKFTLNSAGAQVGAFTSAPFDITATETGSGYIRVRAKYATGVDPTDADTFRVYVTTTGVDPDPATDTPTEFVMGFGQGLSSSRVLDTTLGPYDYADDVRILVRAYNSDLLDESANLTPLQVTVSTVAPAPPGANSAGTDGSGYASGRAFDIATTVIDVPTNTYWRTFPGVTELWVGSTLVFRAVSCGLNQVTLHTPSTLTFVNGSVSGAGSADPVQVVSATELYLCVAGQRKVKIDLTAMELTADSFDSSGAIQPADAPVLSVSHAAPDFSCFQVYDATLGRWRSFLCVDSAGLFSARWHAQTES